MAHSFQIENLPVDIIMDTVLDGLITIDEKGYVQSFNSAATRIFQYEPHEVIGQNIKMLIPEAYHNEYEKCVENYLNTDVKEVIGIRKKVSAKRKSDEIFPIDLGVNEIFVNNKRMFLGSVRDISENEKTENDRDAENRRLQAVLNTLLDGIITINKKGIIQSFNPSAERIFGYQAEAVIGKNVKYLMPEPYYSEHDQYLKNYLMTNEKKVIGIGRQVTAKHQDGTTFPIELGVNEMPFHEQRMFVGSIRDITDRIKAEESIHSYIKQLKVSNQELDDFAYIASHDLKEPLRGISNNAIFLEEDYEDLLDEDGKKRLHRMKYLCKRLETLIDDLLYYSRLGRQDLAVQNTDLNDVINDIMSMMETNLKDSNTEVLIPKRLPIIVCDRPRITEVFRNLMTNALKYNDNPKKIIEIGFFEKNTEITYFVRDNGIGIDELFYEDVFRIFKRLNHEDESRKGTGVGLTFVKKIIERHGGKIWLTSKKGEGSIFYFTIKSGRVKNE